LFQFTFLLYVYEDKTVKSSQSGNKTATSMKTDLDSIQKASETQKVRFMCISLTCFCVISIYYLAI